MMDWKRLRQAKSAGLALVPVMLLALSGCGSSPETPKNFTPSQNGQQIQPAPPPIPGGSPGMPNAAQGVQPRPGGMPGSAPGMPGAPGMGATPPPPPPGPPPTAPGG